MCIFTSTLLSTYSVDAVGVSGETPFAYGSIPLQFEWSVSNANILTIHSLYHADKVSCSAVDTAFG